MNLQKFGKVFTSKFVGTGPSSYENRIDRAAGSQRLRNTAIESAANGIGSHGYRISILEPSREPVGIRQ